ncbi:ABC exporter membrane fusion protein [Aphanizomenon flos-aquae NRERC-008]|uniref:ABC exporter membrane fusion protein n=1 Tax=Aphanizomenon flos-aquae FACHB-1249 TaxID=2692889 RepID=A0ABR8IV99_APHFL|nr:MULTISPECIES: HlyD family efflux transporter periplasmic adaptor subunit [Aphanizomenon]MBD2390364.1 ABC exporter membrane fusion protein [Aphanizomenon flos-aquae FACHB-1171]MBD2555647.1 ABC exporter membrane fusion protein [Aphanizomenon flos-aquae FACHB-1290]MBD2631356.1 ABC exporter membrane fusion protein [Aphanizomenon sp. FACHB-1399]MBD2655667.1 ABC exporter membrane fusion protein [Aphanizomenon flos-aquae FACHB-1265]MBD2674812.1 ABC exporter membrane fusion protein [Aphanizomenon f
MQNHKLQSSLSSQSILRLAIAITMLASLSVASISVFIVLKFREIDHQKPENPAVVIPEIKTVTALGRIEPEGEVIKLSAPISGEGSQVEKILVQEGDMVTKGQVIAILNTRERLQAELTAAKAEVRIIQAKIAQIQAGAKPGEITAQKAIIDRLVAESQGDIDTQKAILEKLQAELLNAKAENKRYQELYIEGAISASEKDSKNLNIETTKKSLQAAQSQLKKLELSSKEKIKEASATLNQISEVRKVDIEVAIAELNRVDVNVKKATINLQQAYVKSPQNGQVFEIYTHPGELISNNGIADIGKTSQMYVVAEVYESDINKIIQGKNVRIVSDVFAQELQGKVERIGLQVRKQNLTNTDPSTNIDNRIVKVYIRLNKASSQQAAKFTNMQVKTIISL